MLPFYPLQTSGAPTSEWKESPTLSAPGNGPVRFLSYRNGSASASNTRLYQFLMQNPFGISGGVSFHRM